MRPRNALVRLPLPRPLQAALLTSVSVLALVMTGAPVRALQLASQRGGSGSAAAQLAASALASAQQSSAVAQQTMSNLLRASQAIATMQQAQVAARAAAANAASAGAGLPAVPNGLGAGGLQPALGATTGSSLWQNASLPTQSISNGQMLVNINQQAAQAILNWQTFNVGRQTTLNFNQQGNSNWVVLNRVMDPSGLPSQILGSITASGQVYVINHNGIVFGGASQVNVGALVASTADIADSQFQTNGIYSTQSNSVYVPSFTNAGGAVTVEPGTLIETATPSTVDAGGGFVLMMGTQVNNAGTIVTPDGQTELAAGSNFVLRPGYSTSANQFSTTAGNEIAAVQASGAAGGGGPVTNSGYIEADTGDITLAGETITQNGVLLSTTDVSQRGTIHLLTSASDPNGSVTLTGNSLTEIVPDVTSGAAAVNAQRAGLIGQSGTNNLATGQFDDLSTLSDLQDESRVEIVSGGSVEFQGNSLTQAPGGQVSVSAVSRIQVDNGATIDVAGSNIALPVADNFMDVNIQGEEESDNPQNRDTSDLFDANVWVDERSLLYVPAGTGGYSTARYYTLGGVLNVTGEEADIGSTIGQWTASGGTITLATGANGAVVAQSGSVFDIAGGSIAYQGGKVPQSYVVASDGNIYNINTAPSDLTYTGIYDGFVVDHTHWGVTQYFGSSLFAPSEVYKPGYTVGRDAGSLVISAPTALFEGTIEAGVIDGQNQTAARPMTITDPFLESQTTVPLQGTLSIDNVDAAVTADQLQNGVGYTPAVTIGEGQPLADTLSVAAAIPASRIDTVDLDAEQLSSFGLSGLSIVTGGPVNGVAGSIVVNDPLALADGGTISFAAPTITLNANLTAHGGAVTLNANGGVGATVGSSTMVANIMVGQNVMIDTTGLWTNAELSPANLAGLAFLNGGSVTLTSTGDLILSSGSLIDASSGGAVLATGATEGGSGGAITLAANVQPNSTATSPFGIQGLVLSGTLRSEGVTQGGALNLNTSTGVIAIGDQAVLANGILGAGTPAPTALTLTQDLVLSAGSALPFNYVLPSTIVGPGQTFLVAAQPTASATNPVVTAAPFEIPLNLSNESSFIQTSNHQLIGENGTVPAGTTIIGFINYTFPAGYVVPANVFPNGLPVPQYQAPVAAGTVLSSSITIPAGSVIPQGAVLAQTVNVQVLNLKPSFFSQGFSSYNITGQNVQVAADTTLNVVEPVLQFTAASLAVPTGSNPDSALSLWLPPAYIANPVTGELTQRAGASLSLNAQLGMGDAVAAVANNALGTQIAPLTIGQGAVITVDPGQSINLSAWGELDVEGAIHAPGGSISILNTREFELENAPIGSASDPALSVWIGADADLDVSGEATTALDLYGHPYGVVQNGGSITIGGTATGVEAGVQTSTEAFVVIRPGAVLNASGAAATLDFDAGQSGGLGGLIDRNPQFVAGNGGSIALSSYSGLYIEGDLLAAAGGTGAAGGTLSLTLESPIYTTNGTHTEFIPGNAGRALRILTVDQAAQPSGLSNSLAPGEADPALVVGTANISADQIANGGFADLSLYGGDAIAFNGNVNLSLAQSLSLNQGSISLSAATPNAQVTLSAPYVLLNGNYGHLPDTSIGDIQYIGYAQEAVAGKGTLTVEADQLDVQNQVSFGGSWNLVESSGSSPDNVSTNLPGFAAVDLISQGDITFLAGNSVGTSPPLPTFLVSTGNISLTASRIYPATGVTALVVAGYPMSGGTLSPTGVLTIANVDATPDSTPADSVFGTLLLDAATINQGGVVDAPLGALILGLNDPNITTSTSGAVLSFPGTISVNFLPNSITSVSANGLTIPYGGTSDGLTYLYDGTAVSFLDPFNLAGRDNLTTNNGLGAYIPGLVSQGLEISSGSINVEPGALLDLSGGGDLTGAGFISGEGGSVDVLRTPLVNANPTNLGAASDKVYAIVPEYQGNYAPVVPDAGAGNPGVGQQITIGAGVPGLPAGTYTLLPSTYALLPGAYRVEIGGANTSQGQIGVASLPNGSYELDGNLGVANTSVRNAIPDEIILTPANAVTTYSQYNQSSYSQFAEQQAATFGTALPSLPIDAKLLMLDYATLPTGTTPALTMNGTLNQAPGQADGLTGAGGSLIVVTGTALGQNDADIDVLGPGQAPISGALSLNASDLDNFHADALVIGGVYWEYLQSGQGIAANAVTPTNIAVYEGTSGNVTVEPGAVLTAPQIFLLSKETVTVASGATVSTIGQGTAPWDSTTNGVAAEVEGIALSNGAITLVPYTANAFPTLSAVVASNSINVQTGATLLAGGTLGFEAVSGLTLASSITLGADNLVIAVPSVNIGTDASLAAAQTAGVLPSGWNLNQTIFNNLVAGNSGAGVPALQSLTLTVSDSVNFFGTVDLSTLDPVTGKSDLSLVLNTPAIYGYGSSSDVATLTTGTLIWSGVSTGSSLSIAAVTPPLPVANGPGTGSGVLDLVAQQIVFGYGPNTLPQGTVALPRQTLGFDTVNLQASDSITANNNSTLAVYQSQTGGVGTGGSLNLITPLLTGAAGSTMGYTAGGALSITAPSAVAPVATSSIDTLGAEIDLNAANVIIDTAVALPTGKLSVNATGNVSLGSATDIDLAGRATPMFDQTEYSWGGDAILLSAQGNITQAAGSIIDVSAVDNAAGTITVQAVGTGAGQVALSGNLLGTSTFARAVAGSNLAGSITVDARTLASGSGGNLTSDFAALNAVLDAGGFYGARTFDLKQGSLTIAAGQTIKAQMVSISLDDSSVGGGSLTVDGTIDASGAAPGSIILAAANNLTLAGSGVLDAHGSVLQADSYGNPIDAENRSTVELSTTNGTLTLDSGATIDVSSPDPDPQGQLSLNAPRLGGMGVSATTSQTITDPVDGSLSTGATAPANAQGDDIAIVTSGPITIKGAQSIALNAFATYKNAPADPNDTNGQVIDQAYLNLIDEDSRAFFTNIYGGDIAAGILTAGLQSKLAGLLSYGSAFHIRPGVEIDSSTAAGDLSTSGDIDLSGYRYGPNADRNTADANYGAGEPIDIVIRAGGNFTLKGSISDGFGQGAETAGVPAGPIVFGGIINDITADPNFGIQVDLLGDGINAYYDTSGTTYYFVNSWVVPNDTFYSDLFGAVGIFAPGSTVAAGSSFIADDYAFEVGGSLPTLATSESQTPAIPPMPGPAPTSALAPMLAAGSQSASIRLVSGADLAAANTQMLQPQSALGGNGNMLLDDSANGPTGTTPNVVRTGTGDLDIEVGGSFSESTLYGVYTAGTQASDVTAAYQTPSADALLPSGYYPTDGGNLTLVAQGNVSGYSPATTSNNIGNWLWEQGGAALNQPGAWSINFGNTVLSRGTGGQLSGTTPVFEGFSGFGTLGGGDLTVIAGGNAGVLAIPTSSSSALDLTVASTGRVLSNGTLDETGGGLLTVNIGSALNPATDVNIVNQQYGVFTDLRGNALIQAGSVGALILQYETANADNPLPANPFAADDAFAGGGPVLAPGDSMMTIETRADLALGDAVDPGRQIAGNATAASANGQTGAGVSWFTLWTPTSGISLLSAGGNVTPRDNNPIDGVGVDALTDYSVGGLTGSTNITSYYPPTLNVVAVDGSIYAGSGISNPVTEIELAPSPVGQIEMLAGDSIYGDSSTAAGPSGNGPIIWAMSGAALTTEATPFNPGYELLPNGATSVTILSTNYFFPATQSSIDRSLFTFGMDTVTTDLHAGNNQPALFYAVDGNIEDLVFGYAGSGSFPTNSGAANILPIYQGATATDVRAGGDIIDLGEPYKLPLTSSTRVLNDPEAFILNANSTGVSIIQAGGSIYYANVVVGGPGTLEVMAGNNIYQGDHGLIESIGPVADVDPYDHSSGANIIVMPGVGSAGPDWSAFADLYFNPANQGDPEQNPGDVAMTYQNQLYQWLLQTYGYNGPESGALAYFQGLPIPQQSVFDLSVYFQELNASGLEFNDASSIRFKSYIRGKDAIAALFPTTSATGQRITYGGSLTMESGTEAFFTSDNSCFVCNASLYDSGIHTEFGGNVQILDPGGAVTVGANSITPGAGTGVMTEGSGDVDIYALDSVELGLSRIFTTFGGNIVVWSATGDINAGKGAKGTLVFAPARRVYDNYGNVALSPTVPTTGAGIATLSPIPDIPPGNINLVAPEGIVDAGEAGIRVSGNINIAALQVVNAANITVQGTSTGLPTVAQPNVGALDSASSTSGAATKSIASPTQTKAAAQPSILIVEIEGYGGDDGQNEPMQPPDQSKQRHKQQGYNQFQDPNSPVQVIGGGELTPEQQQKLTAAEVKNFNTP